MQLAPLALMLVTTLSLAACGGRSSDDAPIAGDGTAGAGNPQLGDGSGTAGAANPQLGDGTTPRVPSSGPSGASGAGDGGDGAPLDPTPGNGGEGSAELESDTTVDGQPVLVPALPGSSAAARVVAGLERVLGVALLDLNARITGGVTLSAVQEDCLGSYEEGLGEPLLAIDCARPLAAGDADIGVARGAFARTDACLASLPANVVRGCRLAYVEALIPPLFDAATSFAGGLPQPLPGSGTALAYAIDGATLVVASDAAALSGVYSCEIDLATGAALPSGVPGGDCDARIGLVANVLDALQPAL